VSVVKRWQVAMLQPSTASFQEKILVDKSSESFVSSDSWHVQKQIIGSI